MGSWFNSSKPLLANNFVFDWTAKAGCSCAVKTVFSYLNILDKEINPNIHYSYQCRQFEVADKDLKYDHIIKIENIKKKTNRLRKNNVINLTPFYTSGHHMSKKADFKEYVYNIPGSELLKHGRIPEYKYFYNDDIKSLVEHIYSSDLSLYNYDYPY
jgi:hypothetical protein